MKRSAVLFCILLVSGTAGVRAQVAPSATGRHLSVTAGGMASLFQPDFQGDWAAETTPASPCYSISVCAPVANTSANGLFGVGAYVDVRFTRWIQIEAEGRWLRFNEFQHIRQDNYLIGPRVPIRSFWKATVYGKALVGYGKMDLGLYPGLCSGVCEATGRFTATAFGGGADIHLNKRFTFRAIDAEYQYWPQWGNSSLKPYGVSMGFGYRIF